MTDSGFAPTRWALVSLMILAFLFQFIGQGRLLADETYTCEIIEYRDPANPDAAGWMVREEQGRRLVVHIGNSEAAFQSVYIRVHGEAQWNALGFSKWLRMGRHWREAVAEAAKACGEWKKKNAVTSQQRIVPPVSEAPQPPRLAEMVVEQRHLVREKAQFRVWARAEYREIGGYRPGEITFTVMARPGRGRSDLSWTLRPGERTVRQQGNHLLLDFQGEIAQPGTYTVRVVLRDSRFRSGAHRELGYEDQLRLAMQVQRPAAEIKEASGNVSVMRIEPATATGGVRVKAGGRVYPSRNPDLLQDLASLTGDRQPDPYANPGQHWEKASSRFVYEGDKISLWGERDRASIREFMNSGGVAGHSVDELIAAMSTGVSRVVLEWERGLRGEAIWDPRPGTANMSGEFIVGASRATSGKWQEKWRSLFGQACQMLFEQGIDEAKEQALDWLLGISIPSGGPVVSLFNLSAGDRMYDDLIYVRLNSRVFIRGGRGRVELFTLEGAPELIDPRSNRRTIVRPGQTATAKRGSISSARAFRPGDLIPPHWLREPGAERRIDRKRQLPVIAGLQVVPAGIRFFESKKGDVPLASRQYRTRFAAGEVRTINWELRLQHPAPPRRLDFQISARLTDSQGRMVASPTWSSYLEKDWTDTTHPYGWGADKPGYWKPGTYTLILSINGSEVARDAFEVIADKSAVTGRISALNADIRKFALFAGERTPPPLAERRFRDSFAARDTRYINWHLQLDHAPRKSPMKMTVATVWLRVEGSEIARHTNQFTMPAGVAGTYYDSGWGNDQGNFWQPGSYRVFLYLDGMEIASRAFTVTGGGTP